MNKVFAELARLELIYYDDKYSTEDFELYLKKRVDYYGKELEKKGNNFKGLERVEVRRGESKDGK